MPRNAFMARQARAAQIQQKKISGVYEKKNKLSLNRWEVHSGSSDGKRKRTQEYLAVACASHEFFSLFFYK